MDPKNISKKLETPQLGPSRHSPRLNSILSTLGDSFGIPPALILSSSRISSLVEARHAFVFLASKFVRRQSDLARILKCDHTTIRNSAIRAQDLMSIDSDYAALVRSVAEKHGLK